jgi:hypothetical protein
MTSWINNTSDLSASFMISAGEECGDYEMDVSGLIVEERNVSDDVDDCGKDDSTITTVDYERPLVHIVTSSSEHHHDNDQQIMYHKDLLLDCFHVQPLARHMDTPAEDDCSEGDIESVYLSDDDDFMSDSWSDSYYTMDRSVMGISATSE